MSSAMSRMVLAAAFVGVTAVASFAQQTTTATETKTFEVLAVDGNQLVVRLPERTREVTVADDFGSWSDLSAKFFDEDNGIVTKIILESGKAE